MRAPMIIGARFVSGEVRTLPVLFFDIETRSAVDLRRVGAWCYASDPSTQVLCIGYAIDDGPVRIWLPGDPVPEAFIEAARNPNWLLVAHNDQFERTISQHILEQRH